MYVYKIILKHQEKEIHQILKEEQYGLFYPILEGKMQQLEKD